MSDFDPAELIDSADATLQHVGLLQAKIDRLLHARDEAMAQVAHRASAAYVGGQIDTATYALIFQRARDVIRDGDPRCAAGWTNEWPDARKISGYLANAGRGLYTQNEDFGWSGPIPLGFAPRPPDGQSVVYVLYNDTEPVYVGSTYKFGQRVRTHRQDKVFTRWLAYPCADREAAYRLEERLLAENLPNLNRRRGR